MHETYTMEDGTIKRQRQQEAEELDPAEALRKYKDLISKISKLQEQLEAALEHEKVLRPAIMDLVDDLAQKAEATEDVSDAILDDAQEKFHDARLAAQNLGDFRQSNTTADPSEG